MIPRSFKSVLSVKMWLTDLSMETRNTFLFPKSDIKTSCTSFHLWCDGYVPITNIFSPYCWVDYSWITFCRKKAHTNYNNCNSISPVILYNYSFGKTFFFFNFHYVAIKWCFSGVFFFTSLCEEGHAQPQRCHLLSAESDTLYHRAQSRKVLTTWTLLLGKPELCGEKSHQLQTTINNRK